MKPWDYSIVMQSLGPHEALTLLSEMKVLGIKLTSITMVSVMHGFAVLLAL